MFNRTGHKLLQQRVRFFNAQPLLPISRDFNTASFVKHKTNFLSFALSLGLMVGGGISLCDPRQPLSEQEEGMVEAFLLAAEKGDLDTVNSLFEKGALVNLTTKSKKFTALMFAANEGHISVVKYLVTRGAKINAQGSLKFGGYTSLIYASSLGHIEVVKHLLLKGADVNLQSQLGNSPLMSAVYGDHQEIIECLVEQGANVNAQSTFGTTALINAAYNNNFKLIKFLHMHGADLNVADDNNRSALTLAIRHGNFEAVSYLIEQGAVDRNAIKLATKYGAPKIIKCVLDNDAKMNIKGTSMLMESSLGLSLIK